MPDWYYAKNNQQLGPVQFGELQAMAVQGQLTPGDLIWTEGMAQWQAASQVQGINFNPAPMQPTYPPAPYPQAVGYATPQYGYQGQYNAPPSQHAGLALTAMILGLVSFMFGGPLLAIPGGICGWVALKGMKRTGDLRNKGFALTGLWIGIVWTALLMIIIVIVVILVAAAPAHM
jgi:hypothetical protein